MLEGMGRLESDLKDAQHSKFAAGIKLSAVRKENDDLRRAGDEMRGEVLQMRTELMEVERRAQEELNGAALAPETAVAIGAAIDEVFADIPMEGLVASAEEE